MTEKEMKRLTRSELLELLIMQTKKNEELSARIADLEAKFQHYDYTFKESGSLAEAFLKLSGIFESADKAAADYIAAMKQKAEISAQANGNTSAADK